MTKYYRGSSTRYEEDPAETRIYQDVPEEPFDGLCAIKDRVFICVYHCCHNRGNYVSRHWASPFDFPRSMSDAEVAVAILSGDLVPYEYKVKGGSK